MRARPATSGQPPKILTKLLSRTFAIITVFLLLAALYTHLVISGQFVEKAKIQENALLAGLVEEGWRDVSKLHTFIRALGEIKGRPKSHLREYIFDTFKQMRVEVFRHRFQSIPSSFSRQNRTSSGSHENIFAIIRSFRAAPTEAILLVIPLRTSHIESIAVALAFADYAREQLYWARDLVFLFANGGSKFAVEAWLSSYHGQKHPFLSPDSHEDLAAHAGTFIGAFALDLVGTMFDRIELQYWMINGKLPNMDLLNLFVLLAEKAGTVPVINGVVRARDEHDGAGAAAQTFANGIVAQSLDEMGPLTAVFGRFGLHAITLKMRQAAPEKQSTAIDLADVVRVVEGGVRSLNNLLEKFHHSYLLYALTHPHLFFSAALFMPLLGLLLAPLLLMALREWFAMGGATGLGSGVGCSSLATLGCSHLFSLAFYALQSALYVNPLLSARTQIAPFSLGFPILAFLLLLSICRLFKMSAPNFHFARFALSIELALFLGALGLVHFPLALLLTILLLPLALFTLLISSHTGFLLRLLGLLLLNPISIGLFLLPFQFCTAQSVTVCLAKITVKMAQIASAHFLHGSWLLPLLSGPVLTICLCFGQILLANTAEDDEGNDGKEGKLE